MPERSLSLSNYRFGFNGQESSDEISGSSNHYEFQFREYDNRIGRFWSVDPLSVKYPWNSYYVFAENRVIDGKDYEGLEYENKSNNNSDGGTYGPLTEKSAEESGATLGENFQKSAEINNSLSKIVNSATDNSVNQSSTPNDKLIATKEVESNNVSNVSDAFSLGVYALEKKAESAMKNGLNFGIQNFKVYKPTIRGKTFTGNQHVDVITSKEAKALVNQVGTSLEVISAAGDIADYNNGAIGSTELKAKLSLTALTVAVPEISLVTFIAEQSPLGADIRHYFAQKKYVEDQQRSQPLIKPAYFKQGK